MKKNCLSQYNIVTLGNACITRYLLTTENSTAQKIFKIKNDHDNNVKVLTFLGKKYIIKKLYTPNSLQDKSLSVSKEKNCAIINFWWTCNYGAILTAYALQKVLEGLGFNAELVNYKYGHKKKIFKNSPFENFAKHHLNISKQLSNIKDLENYAKQIKTFIVGSDQVFNTHLINDKMNEYLLGFTQAESKRIALSASFGCEKPQLTDELRYKYKNYLKTFDYITVREYSSIQTIEKEFDCKADWLIDPVFIADKSIYENICKNGKLNCTNKILTYILDENKKYTAKYNEISKISNKEIFSITKNNVTVEDWLNAIKTCDYLITDSFHGICFAIIFNKPFSCIINKERGSERFFAILKELEINQKCFFENITDLNIDLMNNNLIDYTKINKKLLEIKNEALLKVQKMLIEPKKISNEALAAQINILKDKNFTKPVKNFKIIEYSTTETRCNLKILGLKFSFKK